MILLALLCLAGTAFGQKKVAILPVVDKYDAYKGPDGYGKKLVLRTYLQSAIDNTEGYMAIDRVDYAKALDEAAFQRTGLVSDEEIKKVGEFYGANFVLVAEMAKYDDNQIILIAKLLNVENSSTKTATPKITTLESGALSTTCEKLAQELLKIDGGGNTSSTKTSSSNKVCRMCADNMRDLEVASEDAPRNLTREQAKQYCSGLGSGWYLPSKAELNQLYVNKTELGGFSDGYYWSSTENNSNSAWVQDFSNGFQYGGSKSYTHRVRCVRRVN